jgi:ADP-ribose pyrophosphatase
MIRKWKTIKRVKQKELKIFNLIALERKHPDMDKQGNFVVLESPEWINIIPLTADNKIVLVEQYRHGIDSVTLEVPGGLVEPNEDPRLAAQRECIEETGFAGPNDAELIGVNQPNPAFLDNLCYSYLWRNCEKKYEQKLDGNEDINVVLKSIDEVKSMIIDGTIKHSIVLNAFFFYSLKYGF